MIIYYIIYDFGIIIGFLFSISFDKYIIVYIEINIAFLWLSKKENLITLEKTKYKKLID